MNVYVLAFVVLCVIV